MRLTWWAGALVLGIASALLSEVSARDVALLAPLPAVSAFLLARRGHSALAEGLVACALGLYTGARASQPLVLPDTLTALVDSDRRVRVDGWVVSAPESVNGGSRLRVELARVDGVGARATLALSARVGAPDVLPGDAVRFTARLRSVRALRNPGLADSTLQTRAGGIELFAGVGNAASIERQPERDDGSAWWRPGWTLPSRWAARTRRRLGAAIDRVVGGSAGVLLHTAVLGERRGNDAAVEDGFRAAGATHVLSVSGLHLAAVAFVFFAGVRRLLMLVPRLPLWCPPARLAAALAIPAIAFYTLVTGSAIATVRAALMMGFALAGVALGRPNTPGVAIAAAVWCLLAWSPLAVADISFQLSVVSVIALALLVPGLAPPPHRDDAGGATNAGGRRQLSVATPEAKGTGWVPPWAVTALRWAEPARRWTGRFAAATVVAGLTTAPLVAHCFGEITPAAPLGNALLVPLIELVVVPCGLGGAVLAVSLGDSFGWPFLKAAEWAARAALATAESFRVHASVWLTRSPNAFETTALTIGFACLLAVLRRGPRAAVWNLGPAGWRAPTAGVAVVALLAAVGSLAARELQRRTGSAVVVTFLDVGQGDAAVIQLPGGRTLLVDGGGTYDGSFDPGARVVEPFLRARGITRLEAVALSHPHPDHLGGLHRIVERFTVDALWTSGDNGRNPEYFRLLARAHARQVATPVPARCLLAGVWIEPLGPFVSDGAEGQGEHIGPPEGTTVNDASLVLRIEFAGRAVLFTGDIEANGEGELRGRATVGQTVAADVLKVPHHGSRTSSGTELLDVVRPRMAVMSLGWRNRFGFPRPEVVERYRARGIRLLRTDLHGAVTLTIDRSGDLSVDCERGCGDGADAWAR